jgi:hypothetical protein
MSDHYFSRQGGRRSERERGERPELPVSNDRNMGKGAKASRKEQCELGKASSSSNSSSEGRELKLAWGLRVCDDVCFRPRQCG